MESAQQNSRLTSLIMWVVPPAILVALGSLFYYPSLRYAFQFDDIANINKSFDIRFNTFKTMFMSGPRWIGYWLNAVNFSIGKFDPFYYRLFNVALHITSSLVLFTLLFYALRSLRHDSFFKRYSFVISFLTAGLYLLHPVQTQTVSYVIQGRLEGLAGLFVILIALCFLHVSRVQSTLAKSSFGALLALLSVMASGTKEIAIVTPLLIVLFDWFLIAEGDVAKFKSRWYLHAIVMTCVWGGYLYYYKISFFKNLLMLKVEYKNNIGNVITHDPAEKIRPYTYFISEFKVILHYLWIFLWPFNISVEYDWRMVQGFFSPDCIIPLIGLLFLGFALYVLLRKDPKSLVGFGVLWFLTALAPRSTIIPSPEFIVDYKTYVGSMGWLFVIAAALVWVGTKLVLFVPHVSSKFSHSYGQLAAVTLALIPCGYATYDRNKVWRSAEEFWGNIIRNAPLKARAYNNYGVALGDQQRYNEAIPYFKKAISMDANYPDPCNNLAVGYSAIGKIDEAIKALKQGINIQPYYPEAYNNLASFLMQKQDYDGAKQALDVALKLRPHYGKAYYNLGRIYLAKGDKLQAWQAFKDCCTKADFDNNVYGFTAYASASMNLEKYDDAIFAYQKILSIEPNNYQTYLALARAYNAQGDVEHSKQVLTKLASGSFDERIKKHAQTMLAKLDQPQPTQQV